MKSVVKIQLATSEQCTGCAACVNACPKNCLHMDVNLLGSMQPSIDSKNCISCSLCMKSCPSLNTSISNDYLHAYTLQTKDEKILNNSSSGGAFYEIARYVILHKEGVVFGVRFNGTHVQHDWTETIEGLRDFMGSKYVQSDIGDMYIKVKECLNANRYVLFSGTPCQIAGLKQFLQREYEKLITIDLICHGVPNPIVWEKYMARLIHKNNIQKITAIKFRAKFDDYTRKCNYYNFYVSYVKENEEVAILESRMDNLFFSFFSRNIYRESCYRCSYREIKNSRADFTIGDSIVPDQYPNERGMLSTLVIHSKKGKDILESIKSSFYIFADLNLSHVYSYYRQSELDTRKYEETRPWKLVNFLAKYIPLEIIRPLYMHDKAKVVLKRKYQRYVKKI